MNNPTHMKKAPRSLHGAQTPDAQPGCNRGVRRGPIIWTHPTYTDPAGRVPLRDQGCRDTEETKATAGCAALFILGAVICGALGIWLNR